MTAGQVPMLKRPLGRKKCLDYNGVRIKEGKSCASIDEFDKDTDSDQKVFVNCLLT